MTSRYIRKKLYQDHKNSHAYDLPIFIIICHISYILIQLHNEKTAELLLSLRIMFEMLINS